MICRLCLITIDVDNKVSIFTSTDDTGESQIVKLIAKYLNLEVTQHDAISTTLCHECWNHIDDFHKFWLLVDEKQRALGNEVLEAKCDDALEDAIDETQANETLCNMSDVQDDSLDILIKCETNEVNIVEQMASCYVDCTEEALLDDNISLDELESRCNPKRNVKQCIKAQIKPTQALKRPRRGKKVKSKTANKANKPVTTLSTMILTAPTAAYAQADDRDLSEPNNNRDQDFKPNEDEAVNEWKEIMKFTYSDDDDDDDDDEDDGEQLTESPIIKHKEKLLPKPSKPTETSEEMNSFVEENMQLKCDLCDAIFESFRAARLHYRREHKCAEYIKCCGRRIGRLRGLFEHIKWHMDPEYFKCDDCGKLLKSSGSLENHKINIHVGRDKFIFKCKYCNKSFARKNRLKNHISATHEAVKNLKCQECDKRFTSEHRLLKHIQAMHENVYPYICDTCGMKFKFKPSFVVHVREHNGMVQPPMQCPICGHWSKNKNCLRIHLTTHNKVDVNCKHCGRVCASLSAMRAHVQQMHGRPPSFKCTYCDKHVKTRKDLKEHIATTHTGENLYTCPHCPKEFRSSANMYVHIKKLHHKEWLTAKLEKKRRNSNLESS